ncbi:protein IMPACT-B-like [Oppia nitens]|uniref:protein IMPACT-B-like n=1 Tax=Oppia nitens TaxID=1686743 RepID=UPI0023DB2928|nr:protein IMPACT-B-like [Oppia nitens]
MDCKTLRNDEIEALSAIYGEEWVAEDTDNSVYSIILKSDNNCNESHGKPNDWQKIIRLEFRLPDEYPLSQPPMYTLSAPWMSRKEKASLMAQLEDIYCCNEAQSILYLWIEKSREFLNCDESISDDNDNNDNSCDYQTSHENNEYIGLKSNDKSVNSHSSHCQPISSNHSSGGTSSPALYHGEPLTDRRSTFQAHLSPVHSVTEAHEALAVLKVNKKIESATHNISAYRISGGPHNTCLQDCDDDGESHAGSRLLHLLQILEVKDVVVVVSRWYGGIQLGPDRFKHINNVARDLLLRCGYIDESTDGNHSNQNKHKKKVK